MIRHWVPDLQSIQSKIARLPADIALQLPQGQCLGAADAPVKLSFSSILICGKDRCRMLISWRIAEFVLTNGRGSTVSAQ